MPEPSPLPARSVIGSLVLIAVVVAAAPQHLPIRPGGFRRIA